MKFVILGGGTAGWITALQLNQWFPNDEVTLISSEEIGVIGVGEATTPNIIEFLESLNIPLGRVIRETGATIKNGISFENWNGNGEQHMHGFNYKNFNRDLFIENIPAGFSIEPYNYYLNKCYSEGKPLNEYVYSHLLSYRNKVDLEKLSYALHFDAARMGKLLKDIAMERGVKHINDKYKAAKIDGYGKIKTLILEKENLDGDFFFDCSGMERLLIGKLYGTEWKSYKEHLPMKEAIPYWVDHSEHAMIKPYTTATAMKYGWEWRTPLQDRIGCGYVYDSDYINHEEAQAEIEEYYGHNVEVRKVIKFDAGQHERIWNKNCIALGLSASFIEPLESTSIMVTIGSLHNLIPFLNELEAPSEKSINKYNTEISTSMEWIMNFIYLHYMTKRTDSPFWKDFKENNPPPPMINELLERMQSGTFRDNDIRHTHIGFRYQSFFEVAYGLGLLARPNNKNLDRVRPTPDEFKSELEDHMKTLYTHNMYLSLMKKL